MSVPWNGSFVRVEPVPFMAGMEYMLNSRKNKHYIHMHIIVYWHLFLSGKFPKSGIAVSHCIFNCSDIPD